MDNNLNILEARVLEAVGLIKELRGENDRLLGLCKELEARVDDLNSTNERLNHELVEARNSVSDVEVYEEKRKEIEDKVGGLLQKLEALG